LAVAKLPTVIVVEKLLATHTLSVEIGTFPVLQFVAVVHWPSPASPFQSFVQVTAVLKVAVTGCIALMGTEHVPVPVHAPPHPAKVEPDAAFSVSFTVPPANFAEQIVPQLIPVGLLVTVPFPVPWSATVSA
jgi:hypothetical protein